MANFKDCSKFTKHDDYYTAKESWEQLLSIEEYIYNINRPNPYPRIFEACCMGSELSKSKKYLSDIFYECDITENKEDFLKLDTNTLRDKIDIIITNPPFANPTKSKIISKMLEIDKPFIIILNSTNIYCKWFRETMGDKIKDIQILNPKGKLKFNKAFKNKEGKWELEKKTKDPCFYSVFVTYKLNIPNDKLFL